MIKTVPKRIKEIRFGLISPKEYRKMSVTRVITADTYDDDGFPIEMGLMDPRMGVIDPGLRCKTCGGRAGECPGHFGHVELIAPVIHVGFEGPHAGNAVRCFWILTRKRNTLNRSGQ